MHVYVILPDLSHLVMAVWK